MPGSLDLSNGRSIIVKVDDRGPFVGDRVIDLSYGAAAKLDMLQQGTAYVEVEALAPYQYLPGFQPDTRLAKTGQGAAAANRPAYAFTQPARTAPRPTPVAANSRPAVAPAASLPSGSPTLVERESFSSANQLLNSERRAVPAAPLRVNTSFNSALADPVRAASVAPPSPVVTAAAARPAIPDGREAFAASSQLADTGSSPIPVPDRPLQNAVAAPVLTTAPTLRPTAPVRPAEHSVQLAVLAPVATATARVETPAAPPADWRRFQHPAPAVTAAPARPAEIQREAAVRQPPVTRAKPAPVQPAKEAQNVRMAAAAPEEVKVNARPSRPSKADIVAAKGKDSQLVLASAKPADKMPIKERAATSVKGQRPGTQAADASGQIYLQVGAFSQIGNAEEVRKRLAKTLGYQVRIDPGRNNLHTVRVGPLNDPVEASRLKGRLAGLGFTAPHVVLD